MSRDDPKVVARALFREEWDSSNTLGITPDVRTGWRDENIDEVLVTVSNDEESAESSTGYTGISGASGNPTSRRTGTVQVDLWAEPDSASSNDVRGENAKKVVETFRDEVERILYEFGSEVAAYDFSGYPVDPEYNYLSYLSAQARPEEPSTDEEPIVRRYQVVAAYQYNREP